MSKGILQFLFGYSLSSLIRLYLVFFFPSSFCFSVLSFVGGVCVRVCVCLCVRVYACECHVITTYRNQNLAMQLKRSVVQNGFWLEKKPTNKGEIEHQSFLGLFFFLSNNEGKEDDHDLGIHKKNIEA